MKSTQSSHLISHKPNHSNVKPLKCNQCKFKCKTLSNYTKEKNWIFILNVKLLLLKSSSYDFEVKCYFYVKSIVTSLKNLSYLETHSIQECKFNYNDCHMLFKE